MLDEALPWPNDSGKRIRTLALLERAAREVEVTLAYHAEAPTPAEHRRAVEARGLRLLEVRRAPLRKQGPRFLWDVGRNLFTTYVLPFELASVLLLVGIVGAILLAKRKM